MYAHRLESRLQRFIHDLELVVENYAEGQRTRYNDGRERLQSELDLVKMLAHPLMSGKREQQRLRIPRMQEKFGSR